MDKVKKIPELRFPGFEGEWLNTPLDKHFFNRRESGNENLPIYSVTIDRGMVPRESLERIIGNDAASEKNLLVKANDLTYNMMRLWQGAIGLALQNCMISPAYVVLGPYDNVCSSFFIQLFARSRSLYLFTSVSYGITGDRLRLYYKDFSRIKFPVPNYPEQQKIASFLTSVDQKLTQLRKKKALLEQYKAGVMQQIFSQQIRFKDDEGREFPEWEHVSLFEILNEHKTVNRDNKIQEVFSVAKERGVINQIEHLGRSFASKDTSNYKVVFPGDVIYT
jgi:type I restriction enzyme S subunit